MSDDKCQSGLQDKSKSMPHKNDASCINVSIQEKKKFLMIYFLLLGFSKPQFYDVNRRFYNNLISCV